MPPRNPYYSYDQFGQYPYQPYPQMQHPQPMQQPVPQSVQQPVQQTAQQAQPQIQNGGFVSVRGEQEARNYPVAPGTSVTFKDENAPYCYTKTKGFSQLEEPVFEKYRLVKEESGVPTEDGQPASSGKVDMSEYALKSDLNKLMDTVDDISHEIDRIQEKMERKREESRREYD